jgi:hypothetical protein
MIGTHKRCETTVNIVSAQTKTPRRWIFTRGASQCVFSHYLSARNKYPCQPTLTRGATRPPNQSFAAIDPHKRCDSTHESIIRNNRPQIRRGSTHDSIIRRNRPPKEVQINLLFTPIHLSPTHRENRSSQEVQSNPQLTPIEGSSIYRAIVS